MKAKKDNNLEDELMNDLLEGTPPPPDTLRIKGRQVSQTSNVSIGKPEPTETLKLNESKIISGEFSKSRISAKTVGADVSLVQSENLRFAQQRITELETETERLRRENEQLAAAGETIRRRADELLAENEKKTSQLVDLKDRLKSEKEILEESLRAKDRETQNLKMKIEEFEMRLSTNLQKIRVRERELENRLELIRMESTAVVRSKDEIILDLKRQIDQINSDLENYRTKAQEMHHQMNEKSETLRRTVKALRLALNLLESGDHDSGSGKKD